MQQEFIYRESAADESGNESIFVMIMFRIEPEEENPINSYHYQMIILTQISTNLALIKCSK